MRPLGKTPTRWSPKVAYAIGLIATDGCLSKDGRHIDFTSKDRELVETFKRCLGVTAKTGRKTSGYNGKKYFRVQFGDVLFYKWLLEIGLMAKKSTVLESLKVPEKYFPDFLRGNFDGDGTIYAYWDSRWRSSYMFYIAFASASLPYLEWLRALTKRLIGIKGRIIPMSGVWGLRFAKQESLQLIRVMYYTGEVPHLLRKRRKIERILTTNGVRSR
ncbi:MAG: hypothetical protein A2806_01000 [Candidatus Terrybacteria bacterium RIFCSPHIGHO2_01_FULL_48_17]|uniref:Homing endonuclease LAGLIDADG domain-containing protein n=1 Tax=Candidatus Terrybacteria bacterium RIFCSPHIGHO2_01_FULL_48_17 TaxID=1802362 RepID=A0A1G2PK48_9BACT|nr:MAG: hypothetical protein A2806_01000 [Candidatus Terrybacteria bacterium RIFCSPHIGHO2_01_FULL_48_17]OHA51893.1 MAG: hypothetical protein A3A30_01015 [Candidatus Terrybacteria bacterium RIFCSPLOWO2_01_FULL_48_14]